MAIVSRPRQTSEVDVIERDWIVAAKHDPRAFAPLYERYAQVIYRYCYRQTSDSEEANDLTAQTFIKALERIDRFQHLHNGSFKSWLFAIAHNIIVDRWRKKRPTALSDAMTLGLIDDDPGPEFRAVHRDQMDEVLVALSGLPPNQRDIVELRLSGLNTAEIGDALGLTIGAVKSAQTRAYRKLRDVLNDPEGTSA